MGECERRVGECGRIVGECGRIGEWVSVGGRDGGKCGRIRRGEQHKEPTNRSHLIRAFLFPPNTSKSPMKETIFCKRDL